MRMLITETTSRACKTRKYITENGTSMDIPPSEDAVKRNRVYKETRAPLKGILGKYETQIVVLNIDCLEAAIRLKEADLNPAVLNMASAKRPGGGYKNGAGAQEENIFRRTNYFEHLEHRDQVKTYPLAEFGGIYSPEVLVFRSSEETGYAFMDHIYSFGMIAVSAYVRPRLIEVKGTKGFRLDDKMAEKTKRKIATMLNMALENGHDSIVLSAFGCGAFANPPSHIAKLFHEVIYNDYPGCFKNVTFAIIEDQNSSKQHNPQGNFLPFKTAFESVPKKFKKKDENDEELLLKLQNFDLKSEKESEKKS